MPIRLEDVKRESEGRIGESSKWIHLPTGSKVWIDNIRREVVVGVNEGKPVRQPKIHVTVPEEHRGKGIGAELLGVALKDLDMENYRLPKEDRYYRVWVKFSHHVRPESLKAARRTFEKANFTGDGMFYQHKFESFHENREKA